jgi:hypothetical protein
VDKTIQIIVGASDCRRLWRQLEPVMVACNLVEDVGDIIRAPAHTPGETLDLVSGSNVVGNV